MSKLSIPKLKLPRLKLPGLKLNLSAKTHIALGQTFLVVTVVLLAVSLNLVPDRLGALRQSRATLAEAIATSRSSDEIPTMAEKAWLASTMLSFASTTIRPSARVSNAERTWGGTDCEGSRCCSTLRR